MRRPTLRTGLGKPVIATMLAFALSMTLPGVAGARTIAVPPFDRGKVFSRDARPKVLDAADLAGIRRWLDAHRAGWRDNVVTSPVPEVVVSLGTSAQAPAVTLNLWPRAPEADWRSSIVMEDATGSTWIQALSAKDVAALLGLVQ